MSIGLPVIDKVIEQAGKFIPDKTKKMEFEAELRKQAMSGEFAMYTGQMEVNKVEAQHKSTFVAGWRPFVGWIGGLGFGYTMFHGIIAGILLSTTGFILPPLDPMHYTVLMTILGGMLGLRSWDKKNGTNTDSISSVQIDENGEPVKKKGFFKRVFSRK